MNRTPITVYLILLVALFAVLPGCYQTEALTPETAVQGLPDAENSIVTSEGRFFVTCTGGLYEIVKGSGNYEYNAVQVISRNGLFAGIDEYNGILYMVVTVNMYKCLLIGYDPSTWEWSEVYKFSKALMPNGIAFDSSGNLYVNDMVSLSLSMGRIIKLTMDHKAGTVTGEKIWLDSGINTPNGMKYTGDSLIITDGATVRRIPIVSGEPGDREVLYYRYGHFFDDLAVHGDNLVICDYLNGSVFELDYSVDGGEIVWETDADPTMGPSSVIMGEDSNGLFADDVVVVTSKGIMYDLASNIGNSLMFFTMP